MPALLEWVPAPIHDHFANGRRWKLKQNGVEVARIVQLFPGGLWEAYAQDFYSPSYRTAREAALSVMNHRKEKANVKDKL